MTLLSDRAIAALRQLAEVPCADLELLGLPYHVSRELEDAGLAVAEVYGAQRQSRAYRGPRRATRIELRITERGRERLARIDAGRRRAG